MKYHNLCIALVGILSSPLALAQWGVQSELIATDAVSRANQVELKNDAFVSTGGQAYLQQGFVSGEKAGVWVRVPANIKHFKIDAFRVLMGGGSASNVQVFFSMGISPDQKYATIIPPMIENAAQITTGNYFNDIPATGARGVLPCAKGNDLVGAAIEFTQDGMPSVYRDLGPINPQANLLFANPGGWNYSVAYGLQGNWILRVVGHEATAAECQ